MADLNSLICRLYEKMLEQLCLPKSKKLLALSEGCRSGFQIKLKTSCYVNTQYLARNINHSTHLSSHAKSLSAEMTPPANSSCRFMTKAKASPKRTSS